VRSAVFRGVHGAAGPDATPWTVTWTVVPAAPVVLLLRVPPKTSPTPATNATFVLASRAASLPGSRLEYVYADNSSGSSVLQTWTPLPTSQAVVELVGLTPGVTYRMDARTVTATHGSGPVVSWIWASAPCLVAAADAEVTALEVWPVAPGVRVAHWRPAPALAGVAVQVDDEPWAPASPPLLVPSLALGAWHTLRVRGVLSVACTGLPGLPESTLTWFEAAAAPGAVTIVSAPPALTSSPFATVVFNCSAAPAAAVTQCSFDGGGWAGCVSPWRAGPLPSGQHTLQVRSVPVMGTGVASAAVNATWRVAPAAGKLLVVAPASDGPHRLAVAAEAGGRADVAPLHLTWTVDTVPPRAAASLLSAAVTNASVANLAVACLGEALPARCTFSVQGLVGGSAGAQVAGVRGPGPELRVPVPEDGEVVVKVRAMDGAGNVGRPVTLSWLLDRSPPSLTAALASGGGLWLGRPALSSPTLVVRVTSNEPGVAYAVVLTPAMRVSPSVPVVVERGVYFSRDGVITVPFAAQGAVDVNVTAVDGAGNTSPAGGCAVCAVQRACHLPLPLPLPVSITPPPVHPSCNPC
jgi:hypothetical protein